MKRRIFALVMTVVMCLIISVPAVAAPLDLMMATKSNALRATSSNAGIMTYEMYDDYYGISVQSSIKSVNNTVSYAQSKIFYTLYDTTTHTSVDCYADLSSAGKATFSVPAGKECTRLGYRLYSGALPSPGKYTVQFDFASDFAVTYKDGLRVYAKQYNNNATDYNLNIQTELQQSSGDFYSTFS